MSLTITIPEEIVDGIIKITEEGGFKSPEEFISIAIEQKLLEIKKDKFYRITDEIREGIEERGYSIRR